MILNFPVSRKMWGGNIVPTVAECLTGISAWKNLHLNWSTDWAAWIKPQIDHLVGNMVGARCIRMIGDYLGVFDTSLSQSNYNANWVQFVEYCQSFNVYVYVTCGDQGQIGSMTNAQIYGQANALLSALAGYKNIIGVDVMQEQNAWADGSAASRTIAIYNGVKAGGTSLPLTFSCYSIITDTGTKNWISSISSALDYIDFHFYEHSGYDALNPISPADFNYYRSTYPSLDIFCGEFGSAANKTPDQQESFDRSILRAYNVGDVKFRGALGWAAQDQSSTTSAKWGYYDSSWVQRLHRTRPMTQVTGGYPLLAN